MESIRTFYTEAKRDVQPMTKKEKDAIIAAGRKENGGKPLDGGEGGKSSKESKKSKKVEAEDEEDDDTEDESPEEESEEEEADEPDESEDEEEADDEDAEDDEEPDYEEIARLETVRAEEAEAARKKAEDALAGQSFKKRKKKRDGEDEEDEDDEDKPITKRELTSILSGVQISSQKMAQETQALDIARKHTSSEAEAKAAVTFYKTRVNPTGDLEGDILFAIGGMNRKKQIAKTAEVARALKSKNGLRRDGTGSHRIDSPAGKAKVSKQDNHAIVQSGMTWDTIKKVYKKPLANGKKFFYYDPKTKKRWVK